MTRKERKILTQQKIQKEAAKIWLDILVYFKSCNDLFMALKYGEGLIQSKIKANPQESHIYRSAGYLIIDWLEDAKKGNIIDVK